jgi:hypothetical protein
MRAIQKALQDAELRFPVRIRIGIPPEGLGNRFGQMNAWLDAIVVLMGGPRPRAFRHCTVRIVVIDAQKIDRSWSTFHSVSKAKNVDVRRDH